MVSGVSLNRTIRPSKSGAGGDVLRVLLAGLPDTRPDGLELDRFLPGSCGKASETGVSTTCLRGGGLVHGGGVKGFCGTREVMESWNSCKISRVSRRSHSAAEDTKP
mmetsp:Transcript_90944/g.217020  ORF Transcript_90944/g.217020 Transcript_90944/m.217020 type:complete len:107 (-) Transcript_90944:34-354(-)